MAIYITGDTHGDLTRFSLAYLPREQWSMEDYLLIPGDFGMIFYQNETDRKKLDYLENLNFQILFVDGNHEAFPSIYAYPVEEWCGGKVHRIRHNIRHLMRGQVYNIDGTTIFTMGGGYSLDKAFRLEGVSWWPEELPTQAEYDEARANLAAHGNKVDLIVTHAPPMEALQEFHTAGLISTISPKESRLNEFLEEVRNTVSYGHWYFGHLHQDMTMEEVRETTAFKYWYFSNLHLEPTLSRNMTAVWFDLYNAVTGEKIE